MTPLDTPKPPFCFRPVPADQLCAQRTRRPEVPPAEAGGGWRKPDFQSVRGPSLGMPVGKLSALGAQDGDADNAPGDRFGSARPRGVDVVAAARVSITDWRRPRHHHDNRNRQSVTATMPLGCSNLDRPQPHTAALFIQCAGMVTMAPGGISILARAKRI